MGIWDKLKGELIDIIEWTQPTDSDVLAYRFPRYENEIKYGAKLTVREGQAAVFVNEGKIADVFPPGMYSLETQNMPVLSTLMGWKYGFSSPFKAEVYFILTAQQTNKKWGTPQPIPMRDADFGIVRMRAFGTYAFRVTDAGAFIKELVATDPSFESFEIDKQLRSFVTSKFADSLGSAKLPLLDLMGNYQTISDRVRQAMQAEIGPWGLELTRFVIESVSVPPEVEAAIDKRATMGALGDLNAYTKLQTADAIRDAARNEGGGPAGLGAGLAAGAAIGGEMARSMGLGGAAASPSGPASPPPLPDARQFFVALAGQQAGPFDLPTLQARIASGEVTRDTLVWYEGLAAWTKAGEVAEVAGLLPATPPPLPPS